MPVPSKTPLPSITRFLAGLVTNRNPIDTPISVVGMNVIQHHDALNDGLNMEVSAYNTLVRRPGFSSFIFANATPREFFQYKDLNGAISLFFDEGGQLYTGTSLVSNSVGPNLWSVVPAGNFVYGVNGKTAIRLNNTALTLPIPMGISPPQQPPRVNINTQSKPYFLSSFIPTGNTVGGVLTVSDQAGARQLTITIGSTLVHFNVSYTGLTVTENDLLTTVNVQTQTGTVPNTTTTNTVTTTSGLTGTATGTGISNGVVAYYPSQGLSTLDFDMAYTAPMTMSILVGLINTATPTITAANIPASATTPLAVGVSALLVNGQVASTLYPDTQATAFTLTSNGK